MMHPIVAQAYARERQRDLLREAERRRLVRQARIGQPGLTDRFFKGMGELLIEAGERLKDRHISAEERSLRWADK